MDITVTELAARQLREYVRGTPGMYFAEDHPPLQIAEAYEVQAEVARLRSLAGELIAGYKIGCIGPKIREAFGMNGPIRGFLFKSELRPSGSAISASRHTCLAIEGEMAVQLGREGKILCAFPVIELHNFVFRGRVRSLSELVANNGLHAGVVLPKQEDITAPPVCPESGKLEVRINDKLIDSGPLWSMPGGPEEVIAWLKNHLPDHGLSLQPGHIVLTGTPLGLHQIRPGDRVKIFAEGFGNVEASIVE